MARVTRSSVLLWLQDVLGIQSGAQALPVETSNTIQPVLDVGPKNSQILKATSATATGAVTIYTTPTDKDFYLTYVGISVTKDVTNDNTLVNATVVVGGATVNIAVLPSQTTTAYTNQAHFSLAYPLKLDRGTTIVLNGPFTVGAMSKRLLIGGYILE